MNTALYPVDAFAEGGFTALTIGTFDGLHRGHRYVLQRLADAARSQRLMPLLVTFHPHPRLVVEGADSTLRLLTSLPEKEFLLARMPVRQGVRFDFTPEFARLSPRRFAELLMNRLRPKFILVGYDHRFGRGREGSVDILRDVGAARGVRVEQADPVNAGGRPISSSRIRRLLAAGEVAAANELLGYPYLLMGTVIRGDGWGRRLGYPTANLHPDDPHKLIPASGVYAVEVEWEGNTSLPAMLYIGDVPSFQADRRTIEVHIFDFEGDLYGKRLRVWFHRYFRAPQKVGSPDQLRRLIAADELAVRRYFGYSSS